MILFSSKKLEAALAGGELSSWGKAMYLLLPIVFSSLAGPGIWFVRPFYGQEPPGNLNKWFSAIGGILCVVIVVKGIKKCFSTNESIDGDRFIERFTVLCLPVTIQFAIVLLPTTLAASWYVCVGLDRASEFRHHFPKLALLGGPIVLYLYYYVLDRSFFRFGLLARDRAESIRES